ncbi:MAG: hypothetical protein IJD38_02755 [Clostridia bacterium]|nr:hypothetical protein [Clostridia bacterium]
MKSSVHLWQLVGFGVTSLGGTLLHFLYDWTGGAVWVAPFSGVNESTWEHMKLLFWPMLAFAIAQSFFFEDRRDFWCVKLRGILLGLALIPVLFYTYNGVIGQSPDWINIAFFFVSAAAVYLYEAWAFEKGRVTCDRPRRAVAVLLAVGILFVLFTFVTPEIGICRDPLTGGYGI